MITRPSFIAFFLALCAFAGSAAGSARAVHYEVELTLDLARQTISGAETITFRGSGPVELGAADMSVSEVALDGSPLPHSHADGRLRFTLPPSGEESRRVRLRYTGKPTRGLRMTEQQAFTAFHTNHWMVCDVDPAAKATLRLTLVVPSSLGVVATGKRAGDEPLPGGLVRHHFELERPYSTYVFGFAAAAFREATGTASRVALRYLGTTLTAEELQRIFGPTPEMLAFFEERAGVPYPDDVYTQVLLPNGPAQEMAGLSVMSERYGKATLADPREDHLVAHELAHSWWGNLVTARTWSDFWLNEGLVTFMVAAFKERSWGRDEYDRERGLARLRYERALAKGEWRPLVHTGWKTAEEMGGVMTYSRGALVLHLLRRQLGEAAFWNGLREFTRAHAGGSVDSNDLRVAMERASGQELQRFFAQWVYGDRPDLIARHRLVNGGVEIEIEQRQTGAWTFPLELAVEGATQRITRRVEVTARRQTFRIAFDEPVVSVVVDAQRDLPDPIAHSRPVPMLLAQLRMDPQPLVRVSAITELEKVCASNATVAGCGEYAVALTTAVNGDAARMVRSVAAQALERARGAKPPQ